MVNNKYDCNAFIIEDEVEVFLRNSNDQIRLFIRLLTSLLSPAHFYPLEWG